MATLAGRTLLITGASRGIGREIALRAARDGANVAIAAKTAEPHPKLKGTIQHQLNILTARPVMGDVDYECEPMDNYTAGRIKSLEDVLHLIKLFEEEPS